MMKFKRSILLSFLLLAGLLSACGTGEANSALQGEQNQNVSVVDSDSSGQLIPDAQLVYGPSVEEFDTLTFVEQQAGYLQGYSEEVDERIVSGAQIVAEIGLLYSVNPRLLLAVLEYESDWVSDPAPDYKGEYPINKEDTSRQGLYKQLSWTANELNRGFYTHEVGALTSISLLDGTHVGGLETLNHASTALYYFFGLYKNAHDWELAVSPLGLYTDYVRLFGKPIQTNSADLIPDDLQQPTLQLPFAQGERWHFTSGPHSAWGDGAAWAALDFSPPGEDHGCYDSDAWVRAVADGFLTYSENGAVLQDLEGDGSLANGWAILYMHIAADGRVESGTFVQAGDIIGHPSCEGGVSSGTHVHLARRYNGVWISADRDQPFLLSGWSSSGGGAQYEGMLTRDAISIEALGYVTDANEISW